MEDSRRVCGGDGLVVAVGERLVLLRGREPDDVPSADNVGFAGGDLEALRLRVEVARGVDSQVLVQVALGKLGEVVLERGGDVAATGERLVGR